MTPQVAGARDGVQKRFAQSRVPRAISGYFLS
jgi:hypothetical protein